MSEAPIVYDVTLTATTHLRYVVSGATSARDATRLVLSGDPRAVEVLDVDGKQMVSEPLVTASPRVLDSNARIVFFLFDWLLGEASR